MCRQRSEVTLEISTAPLRRSLRSVQPVRVELVSHTPQVPLWDELVRRYHYLGYGKLLGRRLKYLAYAQNRPCAALSWSAAALRLGVRDRFIGWSDKERGGLLHRLASNSRFLVFPWVEVPNLASHVLSLNLRRLNADWHQHYGTRLWLVETFVDPTRFNGTCYRASNWLLLGRTQGFAKRRRRYVHHGSRKEVYVYVLDPSFRSHIVGPVRKKRPPRLSPQLQKQMGDLAMILRDADWDPELFPVVDLEEGDIEALGDELVQFHARFHPFFGRTEHRRYGLSYLSGLLSALEAKNAERIALEFLDQRSVRSQQRFMKSYRWDDEGMVGQHQEMLAELIATDDGMLTVDSSEFSKKGNESVGVARQYCGRLGKVDNCQSGVFVGYSSEKGYGLLDCQLYMPKRWFTKEYQERREFNLVPVELTFKTKIQIASELLNEALRSKRFPATWIGCDSTFGSDRAFLESLPEDVYYFASIHCDTHVFLRKPKVGLPPYKGRGRRPTKPRVLPGEPQPVTVAEVANAPDCPWHKVVLQDGAKGPIVAQVAGFRVYPAREGLPADSPVWLFIRRSLDGRKTKYAFSNAPEDIPWGELLRASILRWPIEQSLQEGKGLVGMDHYEHRSWPAWHRHMLYAFLGLHFLMRARKRLKKKATS